MRQFRYIWSRKVKVISVIIGLFLFGGVFTGYSQDNSIRFKHLRATDGLSQEGVNCIIQDKYGFMWFGTQDGLNRWDGVKFKIYKNDRNDKSAISDKHILSICEDKEGILWIGTKNGGLNRFIREKDKFKPYNSDEYPIAKSILGDYDVKTICEDSDNNLWIGTLGGGVLRINKGQSIFTGYSTKNGAGNKNWLGNDNINIVFKDQNNKIWIGTDNGLYYFDKKNEHFFQYEIENPSKADLKNKITAICDALNRELWIGTDKGKLYLFDTELKKFPLFRKPYYKSKSNAQSPELTDNSIRCFFKDKDGNLWVGTQRKLIKIYSSTNSSTHGFNEYTNNPNDTYRISNDEVSTIFQDRAGILWFGTYGGGVNIYDRSYQQFKLYNKERNQLSHNTIWSIFLDQNNDIWIGTYEGLNQLNQKTGKVYKYLKKEDISCIRNEQNSNFLWIGTRNNGLYSFNRKTKIFENFSRGLTDKGILCISQIGSNQLLIGTYKGELYTFDKEKGLFENKSYDSKRNTKNKILTILKEKDELWIGTDGGGVLILDNKNYRVLYCYQNDQNNPDSLSHNRVNTVFKDSSGEIWIGTDGGLNRLLNKEKAKFRAYGLLKEDVSNDTIYGILEDTKNNLWISTNSGLFKFKFFHHNPHLIIIKKYDFQDGLQSYEFNVGAYFKNEKTNRMFFGGPSGVVAFFPRKIKKDEVAPKVILTDFLLNNESQRIDSKETPSPLKMVIYKTEKLELTHSQNNVITFEFAALSYSNPHKNKYKYMLDGYDKTWIDTDAQNPRATYTKLPADTYQFKFKGCNKDGIWSDGKPLELVIDSPFWWTLWAKFFYLLIIILFFCFSVRYRNKKISIKRKEELDRRVKEQTEFLEKINNIVLSIFSEMEFKDFIECVLKEIKKINKGIDHASALVWKSEIRQYCFEASIGLEVDKISNIKLSNEEVHARYINEAEKINEDIFIIRNTAKLPHFDKISDNLQSKSMMVMQICLNKNKPQCSNEDKPQAYFILGNLKQEDAFTAQDIVMFEKLKNHIVEAFQKVFYIHQLQENHKELQENHNKLEEKNEELKETQDQLIQTEKLLSMGVLLAGIAHELGNPAGIILLNAEWFSKAWKDIATILEHYESDKKLIIANQPYTKALEIKIEKMILGLLDGSRRIKIMLEELNKFSRKENSSTIETVNIDKVVQSAYQLTQNLIKKTTQNFLIRHEENIPEFSGNSQRLVQVFINLIRNACDALPDHNCGILITTGYEPKSQEIVVQVIDEGQGIEEKDLSKISKPFFTTKRSKGGVGLGLSICHRIICDEHHGQIHFESIPGKGTTVSVHLPVKPIIEKDE